MVIFLALVGVWAAYKSAEFRAVLMFIAGLSALLVWHGVVQF